ncbi:ZIP family metal transporter [Pelotomaculum schinkii]|uniref:ZIP family metal transporter n=1 Tax=Pelotomaculum schinkii TaxID=78350 RepID=UPI00167E0F92|nr:ZIP family metal transporter [Pelotomaculum schinkii]
MGEIVLLGLIAGLGTCLGALLVVAFGRLGPASISLMLGFASGIMTAVIIFDLLPSSLHYGSLAATLTGFAGGILLMAFLDLGLNILAPSLFRGRGYLKMGYLIAAGIALHDLPEGFAIAAGFAAAERLGPILVLAIGLHNIPEGMATAAPLRYGGMGAGRVLALNAIISLVTPLGTFVGLELVAASYTFIGLLLAFAAGAMTYIVLGELAPESRRSNKPLAYTGMLAGLILIMALSFIA